MIAPLYDERELFAQIANGDEKAFRQIFDLYKLRIFHFVLRMVKSESIAEEIVQEIFMKIWVTRKDLTQLDNPGNYMFTMARNKTVDHLRKIANESKMREGVWKRVSEEQDTTYEEILLKESKRLIDEGLQQLSPQKQLIFKLSRLEGYSHDEIAGQLNLSKHTVKNHVVEILRHLKAYLGAHSKNMSIALMLICADYIL